MSSIHQSWLSGQLLTEACAKGASDWVGDPRRAGSIVLNVHAAATNNSEEFVCEKGIGLNIQHKLNFQNTFWQSFCERRRHDGMSSVLRRWRNVNSSFHSCLTIYASPYHSVVQVVIEWEDFYYSFGPRTLGNTTNSFLDLQQSPERRVCTVVWWSIRLQLICISSPALNSSDETLIGPCLLHFKSGVCSLSVIRRHLRRVDLLARSCVASRRCLYSQRLFSFWLPAAFEWLTLKLV